MSQRAFNTLSVLAMSPRAASLLTQEGALNLMFSPLLQQDSFNLMKLNRLLITPALTLPFACHGDGNG